jgi:tetratricopeptide (TPR) repeat protein
MRIIGVLFFNLILLLASNVTADPVDVRAARHAEFGRIVFIWPTPVGHELSVRDDSVTVRFNRAIEANYARVASTLSQYVSNITADADGRSVHIALKKKFDTYSYDTGASIVVEIADVPESQASSEPPSPEPAPTPEPVSNNDMNEPKAAVAKTKLANQNLPKIGVRGGAHADYTRIVFDWPSKVDYDLSNKDGVVTIRFGQAANLDLARLISRPIRLMGDIASRPDSEATQVAMSVPKTSKVRHFLSGSKVVVDIREPTGSTQVGKLPANTLAKSAPKDVAAEPAADSPSNTGKASEVETSPEDVAEKPITNAPETDSKTAEKITEKTGEQTTPTTPAVTAGQGTDSSVTSDEAALARSTPAVEEGPATSSGDDTAAESATSSSAEPVVAVADVDTSEMEDADITISESSGDAGGMDLRFDWTEPVAAAVFRRAGKLWIVFDAKRRVDPAIILGVKQDPNEKPAEDAPPPPPNLSQYVFGVNQLAATSGTVLRMTTSKDVNPTLKRDGFNWIFTFRKQGLEPKTPLEINAQPDSPVGARIFVPTPEPSLPIGVTDPDIGDNLVIVPITPLSHGIAKGYTYPEVTLPQTGQGILIVANTDNMRVRPLRQGVELTSAIPLSISSVTAEEAAGSKLSAIGPVSRLLDLERWELQNEFEFGSGKQQLQSELARAKGLEAQQSARWNLANFYFANSYGAETLGVLRQMVVEDPEYENKAELKLLRGASQYLLGRYGEAAEDLGDPGLDVVDEGAFWRAVVIARSGQMIAAAHELRRTGSITQPYPKPLRFPLALLIAEAAVEIGDIENAVKFLEALNSGATSPKELAAIAYIEGKMAEISGDEDGAVGKFEEAIEGNDRAVLVKAAYARLNLLLQMDRMDADEAIEILEGLRFLWRGDNFEFNLLRRLGTLYIEENGYRRGLQALRQAATYYREHEEAAQITQQMSDTFNFLYLEDGADRMAPVKAIALYDEFRELTPAGRKGDEMIRKLADRLVKVDLFEQAAELLDGQVRFRLQGLEKAQVGTNLALVHALAKDHERVLEVLDATNVADLPEDVANRRRHLRALSLIGLNQNEQAVELLKRDKTLDADLIRAEMYWLSGDWVNASQFLRRVVRAVGARPGREIDNEQAIRILNLAASYTLSGNERALVRLRSDYGAAMERSQFNEAFQLIAAPLAAGLISPTSVTDRVETVTNFRSFLDKYKEQLSDSELSGLTNVGRKMDESNLPLSDG